MKNLAMLTLTLLLSTAATAYTEPEDAEEPLYAVFGPRVGVSWRFTSVSEFSEDVGTYFPIYSLFGACVELRIPLGETKSHFVVQEVLLVGGIDQSIALPSGAVLVGYRGASGFELGVGPILSFDQGGFIYYLGFSFSPGVVVAAGYTFSLGGIFVPIDVSWTVPNQRTWGGISVTTGFSFRS